MLGHLAPSALLRRAPRAGPVRRNAPRTACHRRLHPPASSRRRPRAPPRLRARIPKAAPRRISAIGLQPPVQRPLGEVQQLLRDEGQNLRSSLRKRVPGLCGRVSVTTGARKNPRHGATSNGSACKSARYDLGAGSRQAEPRRARQSGVVAVLRIVTCDVDFAPHRGFFRAPPLISKDVEVPCPSNPPQDSRRKREPQRRSPAQVRRQGNAKHLPRREDYGWGRAGGVIKTDHLPRSATTPQPHPRQPQRRCHLSVDVLQDGDSGGGTWSALGGR